MSFPLRAPRRLAPPAVHANIGSGTNAGRNTTYDETGTFTQRHASGRKRSSYDLCEIEI